MASETSTKSIQRQCQRQEEALANTSAPAVDQDLATIRIGYDLDM